MVKNKIDNTNYGAKIKLRMYFLDKYYKKIPPVVFDCCQGDKVIWTQIQKTFSCEYWGVDIKKKAGRIRFDSAAIIADPKFQADVVDIDTYGSPWRHYMGLVKNVKKSTTIFLTWGNLKIGGGPPPRGTLEILGAKFRRLKPPNYLRGKIFDMIIPYMLSYPARYGLRVLEGMKCKPKPHIQYIGLHIIPIGPRSILK